VQRTDSGEGNEADDGDGEKGVAAATSAPGDAALHVPIKVRCRPFLALVARIVFYRQVSQGCRREL
jgi:hypothetical protein